MCATGIWESGRLVWAAPLMAGIPLSDLSNVKLEVRAPCIVVSTRQCSTPTAWCSACIHVAAGGATVISAQPCQSSCAACPAELWWRLDPSLCS